MRSLMTICVVLGIFGFAAWATGQNEKPDEAKPKADPTASPSDSAEVADEEEIAPVADSAEGAAIGLATRHKQILKDRFMLETVLSPVEPRRHGKRKRGKRQQRGNPLRGGSPRCLGHDDPLDHSRGHVRVSANFDIPDEILQSMEN